MQTLARNPMAEGEQKTMSIRLDVEAIEAAKIAASYKRLTVLEYASRVLLEAANRDIEEGHRQRSAAASPPEPKKSRKPRAGD
jgi:hypothetical protein